MHIPDGFLDVKTSLLAGAIALPCVAVALRDVARTTGRRSAPTLGVTAAFVFAAQMVNFPVAGGTSGHLLGGVLCAVLLGPSSAIVVMACVLAVQTLLFADGGLAAYGANLLNMGIVDTMVGWAVYRMALRLLPADRMKATVTAAAFGAWCGTVAAATACAGELALAGTAPWNLAFPAMAGVHMLIGLGEAAITGIALGAIGRLRPDLLERRAGGASFGYVAIAGAALAVFVAPFASFLPDGLESVAHRLGFAARAGNPAEWSLFPEYHLAGLSPGAAVFVAGAAGALVAFGLSWLLARLVTRHTAAADEPHETAKS